MKNLYDKFFRLFSGAAPGRVVSAQEVIFPFPEHHGSEGVGLPDAALLQGICPVCGLTSRFDGFGDNLRESGFCSNCTCFNRQRQLAYLIRARCGLPESGPLALPASQSVYNTETNGALHRVISTSGSYVCSEFFGSEYAPGQDVGGLRHENLQNLSFCDQSIDILLSSDVLEHMPAPYVAHAEIFRVLKPGGGHLFTVPFNQAAALDDTRARLVDGEIEYLAEKLYHGDPVRPEEGILVWTIFGLEMLVRLAEIGFVPSVWSLHDPSKGILGAHALVFEALRPARA